MTTTEAPTKAAHTPLFKLGRCTAHAEEGCKICHAKRDALHTPGPWKLREHPTDPDQFYVSGPMTDDHPYLQSANDVEILSDEGYPRKRADARLISAAPEMLEALERLYQEWRILACQCIGQDANAGHPHCIVRHGLPWVDAAIQKARGQQ